MSARCEINTDPSCYSPTKIVRNISGVIYPLIIYVLIAAIVIAVIIWNCSRSRRREERKVQVELAEI